MTQMATTADCEAVDFVMYWVMTGLEIQLMELLCHVLGYSVEVGDKHNLHKTVSRIQLE